MKQPHQPLCQKPGYLSILTVADKPTTSPSTYNQITTEATAAAWQRLWFEVQASKRLKQISCQQQFVLAAHVTGNDISVDKCFIFQLSVGQLLVHSSCCKSECDRSGREQAGHLIGYAWLRLFLLVLPQFSNTFNRYLPEMIYLALCYLWHCQQSG